MRVLLKARGKCLDTSTESPGEGTKPHLWGCDAGNGNQQWTYDSSTKLLEARGKCLDTSDSPGEGTKPHMWGCDAGNGNQQWELLEA